MCAISSADYQTRRTSPEQLADLLERYELPKAAGIHICLMACYAGHESQDGCKSFATRFAEAMLLRGFNVQITAHPTAIALSERRTYACARVLDGSGWVHDRTTHTKIHCVTP